MSHCSLCTIETIRPRGASYIKNGVRVEISHVPRPRKNEGAAGLERRRKADIETGLQSGQRANRTPELSVKQSAEISAIQAHILGWLDCWEFEQLFAMIDAQADA